MLRSFISLLSAILYMILTLPVLLVLHLIGKKRPEVKARVSQKMIRWIFRVFLVEAGTKVTVIGQDRIPADTAALYIGNHRSIYDILITYQYMTRPTSYVAKKELTKIPIFRIWAVYIGVLFFDRSNLKEGMKMILDGIKLLKAGQNVFIFPEGTRSKNEKDYPLLEFHEGSFRLSAKSGCPIVPVCLCNTANIWENHFPWLKRQHIVVEFCEPIYPADIPAESKKQVGAYVREIMNRTIEKNSALV